jgi:hypothetical protein
MSYWFTGYRRIAVILWALALLAIAIWSSVPGYVVGWDLAVIRDAAISLRAGHDPYSDAIAVQELFHRQLGMHPHASVPLSYVYSPITLPFLRWASAFPFWLTGTIYWAVYIAAVGTTIWFGTQFAEAKEQQVVLLMASAALFFPGLLQNDVLFSGNVAFILYGSVFVAAFAGWRGGSWIWFYAAVLVASFFKAPMLSLLAIAPLSSRRQWTPVCLTAVAGVGLFLAQRILWPSLFDHYLVTLDIMFRYARDFSSSPAGLMAQALYDQAPYRDVLIVSYVLYAVPVFGIMLYLSRKFFGGRFSLKQWVPVMMIGVVLLNPRIIEYDVAPITLLMALVAWRAFARQSSWKRTIVKMSVFVLGLNLCVPLLMMRWPTAWKCTECFLLLGLFAAGAWNLNLQANEDSAARDSGIGVAPAWLHRDSSPTLAEEHAEFRSGSA